MPPTDSPPSTAEFADEAITLTTGLGILTIALAPLALPALILVIVPLVVLAIPVALLAAIVIAPIKLVGRAFRASRARRARAGEPLRLSGHPKPLG
jgi:hypothetical protein